MESPHSQDANGGEERASPKGATFDRDSLLDLVRSIVGHSAVRGATVEMVREGLSQPAEARMSRHSRWCERCAHPRFGWAARRCEGCARRAR